MGGIALVLALMAATVPPGLAAEPRLDPDLDPAPVTLVADGPFGRVEGIASASGTTPEAGLLPVLDAWARGTTMVVRPTDGTLAPWRAMAIPEPALDATSWVDLGGGDGDAIIPLPTTGLYLVRVDATIRPDGSAVEGSWWWRIAVPDRDLPEEETGPPPPAILLGSGDDVASLEQGSGCHLGTCGDIGHVSPPDLLPTIRTIQGAPLSMSLADASGMVGWWIAATPLGGGEAVGLMLGEGRSTWATETWVVAPTVGDWLVEASVTFDRERGHFDGYGRLIVEAPETE